MKKMTSKMFSKSPNQDHRITTTNDTLQLPRFPHRKPLKWLKSMKIQKSWENLQKMF